MRLVVLLFLSGLLLAGCQTPAMDSEFAGVQQLAEKRTGQRVRWNQSSADDRAVESAVDELLAHELSVDQAVQIALLNNRSLQATFANLGIAQADVVQAGLLSNPVFDASIRFPDRSPRGPNVELSITQEFIDLLLIPARSKLAGAQLAQAKLQIAQAVVDLVAEVRIAYFNLAGAQQMLEMRSRAADAMKLSAETAQRMYDAGNLNDLNLASYKVAYESAHAELESARAEMEQDRQSLTALLGLRGDQEFSVTGRLNDPIDAPPIESLEKLALSQRLDVAAAKQAIEVAQRSMGLTQTERFLPSAGIGVDTEREPDGTRVTGPIFSLPIPLFDQGQAVSMRGRAEMMQASDQYRALVVRTESQVRASAAKMLASRARADRFRTVILPLRHQIVEESQLQYNGMLLDVLNLLQVKQNEIDAGRDHIAALRDYWVAHAELERTVGGAIPSNASQSQPASQGE